MKKMFKVVLLICVCFSLVNGDCPTLADKNNHGVDSVEYKDVLLCQALHDDVEECLKFHTRASDDQVDVGAFTSGTDLHERNFKWNVIRSGGELQICLNHNGKCMKKSSNGDLILGTCSKSGFELKYLVRASSGRDGPFLFQNSDRKFCVNSNADFSNCADRFVWDVRVNEQQTISEYEESNPEDIDTFKNYPINLPELSDSFSEKVIILQSTLEHDGGRLALGISPGNLTLYPEPCSDKPCNLQLKNFDINYEKNLINFKMQWDYDHVNQHLKANHRQNDIEHSLHYRPELGNGISDDNRFDNVELKVLQHENNKRATWKFIPKPEFGGYWIQLQQHDNRERFYCLTALKCLNATSAESNHGRTQCMVNVRTPLSRDDSFVSGSYVKIHKCKDSLALSQIFVVGVKENILQTFNLAGENDFNPPSEGLTGVPTGVPTGMPTQSPTIKQTVKQTESEQTSQPTSNPTKSPTSLRVDPIGGNGGNVKGTDDDNGSSPALMITLIIALLFIILMLLFVVQRKHRKGRKSHFVGDHMDDDDDDDDQDMYNSFETDGLTSSNGKKSPIVKKRIVHNISLGEEENQQLNKRSSPQTTPSSSSSTPKSNSSSSLLFGPNVQHLEQEDGGYVARI